MGRNRFGSPTLIVVNMQNDFITGALANPDAEKIVDPICDLIKEWRGSIIATRDTHGYRLLKTDEEKGLPVEHCIRETAGWCIEDRIMRAQVETQNRIVDSRNTFAIDWFTEGISNFLQDDIYIVGTRTDVCVISNALILKSALPGKNITVYENLCAGTTPEKHKAAIEVMKSCQIDIETYKGEKSLDK